MKKQIVYLLLISSYTQLFGIGSSSDLIKKAQDSGNKLLQKGQESTGKLVEKGQPIIEEEAALYKKYLFKKYGQAAIDKYILGKDEAPKQPSKGTSKESFDSLLKKIQEKGQLIAEEEATLYKKYLFEKYGQAAIDKYILGEEAPKKTSKESIKETPTEAIHEASEQTSKERIKETPTEAIHEVSEQTSKESIKETPIEAIHEAPKITPKEIYEPQPQPLKPTAPGDLANEILKSMGMK